MTDSVNRIFPRNLTARASFNVAGNPPSTRPESGVGNCYPGLEYDHRNLDRRFFPGLVVEFASQDDAASPDLGRRGARVVAVDTDDPDLGRPPQCHDDKAVKALRASLARLSGNLSGRSWFLESIVQDGTTISLDGSDGSPLDGLVVWRLVRSLRPGPVSVRVVERGLAKGQYAGPVQLDGWRRTYTDPQTGVIDAAYQPGELTQSLCSPWTHDFRDCSCTYWASNHPDIVMPAVQPGEPVLPGGASEDLADSVRVDWLRDPDLSVLHPEALPSQGSNRPFQISYFQINREWQDLAVVLEGREVDGTYVPRSKGSDWAEPFATDDELWARIVELAGLEHLVALLYLYARFSLLDADDAKEVSKGTWPQLANDVTYARSVLLEVATGEMQHLRIANHLLWGLSVHHGKDQFSPVVVPPALIVPARGKDKPAVPAQLQPLTPETLQLFVDIERGSGYIDGQYARVTATLRQPDYPPHLYQLASNVANDGEQHFLNFRDIQAALRNYGTDEHVYLRPVVPADPADPRVAEAMDLYLRITRALTTGYELNQPENQQALAEARALMFDLQTRGEALAKEGLGIPFLSPWQ
ncbi:hypothetical protein D0Z08_19370 [Nocardioides immobilis]|uniref:Iminophenyl-pyruvate dimer synthase domain-containing protein n=1 Tax=Nocardioides immobilis TaxID=2049295 RepID=A0A417XYE2_9ACTN|nr:ferritin-like domain-containing protein [Nocardioides immobilis]RHW25390.1 hypothetical protein D0Z08_19370 [Nocardioides immobilis]